MIRRQGSYRPSSANDHFSPSVPPTRVKPKGSDTWLLCPDSPGRALRLLRVTQQRFKNTQTKPSGARVCPHPNPFDQVPL